jgi:hypothetical protein
LACALGVQAQSADPPRCSLALAANAVEVSVRDAGAQGDGTTDDTAAVQAAIDQAAARGGVVRIPDGDYRVDAVKGIDLRTGSVLLFADGAQLRALPNDKESYTVLRAQKVSNVSIVGGTVVGDRHEHRGKTGEWGMGLTLTEATNVLVDRTVFRSAWGDGIYINRNSSHVSICRTRSEENRRQGLSIIAARDVLVHRSMFRNTAGTAPQCGLDIEPNKGDKVDGVVVQDSVFEGNAGCGIAMYVSPEHTTSSIDNVQLLRNTISNNRGGGGGIAVVNTAGHLIEGNTLRANRDAAILLGKGTKGIQATGNSIDSGARIVDQGRNTVRQ